MELVFLAVMAAEDNGLLVPPTPPPDRSAETEEEVFFWGCFEAVMVIDGNDAPVGVGTCCIGRGSAASAGLGFGGIAKVEEGKIVGCEKGLRRQNKGGVAAGPQCTKVGTTVATQVAKRNA